MCFSEELLAGPRVARRRARSDGKFAKEVDEFMPKMPRNAPAAETLFLESPGWAGTCESAGRNDAASRITTGSDHGRPRAQRRAACLAIHAARRCALGRPWRS